MDLIHVRLLVNDFKSCFLFYRDIMHLKVNYGSEDDVYADFECGRGVIALFSKELMMQALGVEYDTAGKGSETAAKNDSMIIIESKDVDGEYESFISRGWNTLNKPEDRVQWGIRCFHMRDPEGNLIEINSPLKQ